VANAEPATGYRGRTIDIWVGGWIITGDVKVDSWILGIGNVRCAPTGAVKRRKI
jgi:hypothetical protein